ncbi:MAG: patatin-like phospholipase family protein [Chloroflexaceae bacterium]|nr:patatin-like phospholipase family protein [Chloroflexaceae bacterium]
MVTRSSDKPKPINLALQGGGSHGSFTWGVLDRLLADERIDIASISGTSAGAMNAVVLAAGMQAGGREGARQALTSFWRSVSLASRFSPIQRTPLDWLMGRWTLDMSPAYWFFDTLSRSFSPYELNPFNYDPLRILLTNAVDFEQLRTAKTPKVFIAATNVRTGLAKVFRNEDLTPDAVLASACLPFMHQAVEIGDEAYWDGGYMGNPVLFPLLSETDVRDLMVVQVNPIYREEVPKNARDILNRLNEITFNASLVKELRVISLMRGLVDEGSQYRVVLEETRLHRIEAESEMSKLGVSSKMNAEWAFLSYLRDIGWQRADQWLERHIDQLGQQSTFDVADLTPPHRAEPLLAQRS